MEYHDQHPLLIVEGFDTHSRTEGLENTKTDDMPAAHVCSRPAVQLYDSLQQDLCSLSSIKRTRPPEPSPSGSHQLLQQLGLGLIGPRGGVACFAA